MNTYITISGVATVAASGNGESLENGSAELIFAVSPNPRCVDLTVRLETWSTDAREFDEDGDPARKDIASTTVVLRLDPDHVLRLARTLLANVEPGEVA